VILFIQVHRIQDYFSGRLRKKESGKEIQEKHISFRKKHSSILISDIIEVIIDAKGNKTENNTLLAELPSAKLSENWIWDFDLMHADYNMKKSQFKVAAILF